ncbi:MAG: HAD family hydrolase [Clostridiales bacterium]|jgi:phosphoglycolate phosphatase|nr:HAD family hydrolase [Clostridiales bacterium]
MEYNTVLFDLDGTLLNTLYDLHDSINFALRTLGLPERTRDEVRMFVGNGVANLIDLAVPDNTAGEIKSNCLSLFREHYNANMANKTRPYDGISDLLSALRGHGIRMAVISNKYDSAVKELCGKYFGNLIELAFGAAEDIRKKPAPDIVNKALDALGSEKSRTLYAGDSDVDIKCALNAGVTPVGVSWGFRDVSLLEESGADYIINNPAELLDILEL